MQVQEEQAAARRAERLKPANAATTVQTVWRGWRARRELARLQQERAEAEAAIRAVQAQVRGWDGLQTGVHAPSFPSTAVCAIGACKECEVLTVAPDCNL